MSSASEELRKAFGASDAARDKGLTTPEDIIRYDDIQYGNDPTWNVLDLYRPKTAGDKVLPVIISFHGGGWVYGDKSVYQFYCMNLAERGFAVVNYSYRLAPEVKFPAPLEDTNNVMKWIKDNADTYHLDLNNIFGVGDSAGGNGLSLYAAICTNPEYAANFDFKVPDGITLKAVALNCGAYLFKEENGELMDPLMKDYLPEDNISKYLPLVNPAEHVTKDYPPTLLMSCNEDFLLAQMPVMQQALLKAGVRHTMCYYGDSKVRLPHVFHCNIRCEEATKCNDEECDFFKRFI